MSTLNQKYLCFETYCCFINKSYNNAHFKDLKPMCYFVVEGFPVDIDRTVVILERYVGSQSGTANPLDLPVSIANTSNYQ